MKIKLAIFLYTAWFFLVVAAIFAIIAFYLDNTDLLAISTALASASVILFVFYLNGKE